MDKKPEKNLESKTDKKDQIRDFSSKHSQSPSNFDKTSSLSILKAKMCLKTDAKSKNTMFKGGTYRAVGMNRWANFDALIPPEFPIPPPFDVQLQQRDDRPPRDQ